MKKIILSFIIASQILFAKQLQIGEIAPNHTFHNQHKESVKITNDTKKLIIVFSKDDGEKVKGFLEKNQNYLQTNKALYFADLSEAPSLVISMFMRPKFKKYPYSMVLLEEKEESAFFPKKENKITVISLENQKVTKIEYLLNL